MQNTRPAAKHSTLNQRFIGYEWNLHKICLASWSIQEFPFKLQFAKNDYRSDVELEVHRVRDLRFWGQIFSLTSFHIMHQWHMPVLSLTPVLSDSPFIFLWHSFLFFFPPAHAVLLDLRVKLILQCFLKINNCECVYRNQGLNFNFA